MRHAIRTMTLGDFLGSLHYMGECAMCRSQFMSRFDRVARTVHGRTCGRCVDRLNAAHDCRSTGCADACT